MKIFIDNITEINSCELEKYPGKSIVKITLSRVKYYPGQKDITIQPDGFEDLLLFIGGLCNDNNITIEELKEYVR